MNRLSMRRHWFLAGAVGCFAISSLGVILPGCFKSEPAEQPKAAEKADDAGGNHDRPVRVKVVRPTRADLIRSTTLPAQMEGYEKTEIQARVAGFLRCVNVDIGDRVKKKDVLAELRIPEMDQEVLQKESLLDQAKSMLGQAKAAAQAAEAMVEASRALIDEAEADVASAEADLAFRKVDYERYVQLQKDNATRGELVDAARNQYRAAAAAFVSVKAKVGSAKANWKVEQAKHVKAQADVESAKSNVKVTESNLEQARIMQDFGKIVAPYDGVITRRNVDTGAFIPSAATGKAEPLFSMVFVDRLRIIADIAEADSALVKLNQEAKLHVDALLGRQFPCKVVRFATALDRGTRTMRAELELDVHDPALRPGMFGSVTIELVRVEKALLLATNLLLPSADKPAVMVIENGRAKRREIVIGANDGIRMHVKDGLKGDEAIISDGKNMVRDGQSVEIIK